jgi:hypothetical protein
MSEVPLQGHWVWEMESALQLGIRVHVRAFHARVLKLIDRFGSVL